MGADRRTVNTSTTPHIFDQLGTENACKTQLCWFIVMIWVLACNNMLRYECDLESFHRNPTILETVSIASKWVNMENFFYWNTMTGNNSSTNVSLSRYNVKITCKNIFHIPRWPVGVKSNYVILRGVSWSVWCSRQYRRSRQIWRLLPNKVIPNVFIKLAFEFGCDVIFMSHPMTRSLGSKLW